MLENPPSVYFSNRNMLTYSHGVFKIRYAFKQYMCLSCMADTEEGKFMKAVYTGTFDPITNGHLDIIERASRMFDEVTVLIMSNPAKKCLFTTDERKRMIEKSLSTLKTVKNVSVLIGEGLTVEMARKLGAVAIIRGIRAVSDYEYELKQATANMKLNGNIETMLMIARPEYSFLSSSVVKEIAVYGGSISSMVPDIIIEEVNRKFEDLKGKH